MQFVNDDDAQFVERLFFQEPVDQPVGLLDGADGNVDGLKAARRVVSSHEAPNSNPGVLQQMLARDEFLCC